MKPYPVSDDLVFCENAAYLPRERTLVISDLQLGYEQQLRSIGHNIVYDQARRMMLLLERLISEVGARRLLINGDLKHEFGRISGQERRDVLGLLRKLKKRIDIVVVRGNHDTITRPLTDELGIDLLDSWSSGGFYAIHGHDEKTLQGISGEHTLLIGHMHPAVILADGVRKEKYKCFLISEHAKRRVVVLPSFSTIAEGTDVLLGHSNSPLVDESTLDRAEVYVIADGIRKFGRVHQLKRILG